MQKKISLNSAIFKTWCNISVLGILFGFGIYRSLYLKTVVDQNSEFETFIPNQDQLKRFEFVSVASPQIIQRNGRNFLVTKFTNMSQLYDLKIANIRIDFFADATLKNIIYSEYFDQQRIIITHQAEYFLEHPIKGQLTTQAWARVIPEQVELMRKWPE